MTENLEQITTDEIKQTIDAMRARGASLFAIQLGLSRAQWALRDEAKLYRVDLMPAVVRAGDEWELSQLEPIVADILDRTRTEGSA